MFRINHYNAIQSNIVLNIYYLSINSGERGGVLGVTKEGLKTVEGSKRFLLMFKAPFCPFGDPMDMVGIPHILSYLMYRKHLP